MNARNLFRKSLTTLALVAAGLIGTSLISPSDAKAQVVVQVGGRGHSSHGHGSRGHYSRNRHGSVHRSYGHGGFHYDRVYHPEYYHWTPRQGLHTHGHYDLVPHRGRHYQRSGIGFYFGF